MLYKGLVTKSKDESVFVWSKSLEGEAIIDKRMIPANRWIPSVGDWIVFTVKNDSNFVDDFIDIPNLLPTKLDEHGSVMIKTRISFRSSDFSGDNLLAHSADLGVIGIFQNFPNLNKSYDYDVWVEKIPQALSNLEHLYKTSWYISEEVPQQISETPLKQFPSLVNLPSKHNHQLGLPSSALEDGYSYVSTHTIRTSCSSGDVDVDELQELNRLRERSLSNHSYFAEQQFLDSQPCTSAEGIEGKNMMEGKAVVGIITSTFNEVAFVWSSVLGRGMISLCFGQLIRHGQWIKFIPASMNDMFLQGRNELRNCKYTAKDWCIISPVYPTHSYRTMVSVQVKLFIPESNQYGFSNLWAEFFGTVHDSWGRVAEFASINRILGRCLLVRITETKNDCDISSKWVVHKVLRLLEDEESVPRTKSRSFAADALRYMKENLHIHCAMKNVDWNLAEQLREPHLLSNDILEHRY